METVTGILQKMKSALGAPIQYSLRLGTVEVPLNAVLGKTLSLRHTGLIYCIQCGRKTNKSFQQGHCFPCLQRLSECNLCTIHPERCQVEHGTCPTDDWAHAHCHQDHIVYLANSSGLKVGITRHTQVPTRWIDQGAKQAIPIFRVSNRYRAGAVEVALKAFVSDRTNWRALLKQEAVSLDLLALRDDLLEQAKNPVRSVVNRFGDDNTVTVDDAKVLELNYPVLQYPEKIASLSLDKTPLVEGCLQGIKGQYLIFDVGVMNVRKFGGYEVQCEIR